MSAAVLQKQGRDALQESGASEAPEDQPVLVMTAKQAVEGRKKGCEAQKLQGKERRVFYWKIGLQALIDNYDQSNYLTRHGIITNIHAACVAYEFRGKLGRNIKMNTISRWLREDVEHAMRLEAIDKLIKSGRVRRK